MWNLYRWGWKDFNQELIDLILEGVKPSQKKVWYIPQTYQYQAKILNVDFHDVEVSFHSLTNNGLNTIILLGDLEGENMVHEVGSHLNPPSIKEVDV